MRVKLNFTEDKKKYEDKAFIPHEGSKASARLEEESKTPISNKTEPTYDKDELNSIMKALSERKDEEKSDEMRPKENQEAIK